MTKMHVYLPADGRGVDASMSSSQTTPGVSHFSAAPTSPPVPALCTDWGTKPAGRFGSRLPCSLPSASHRSRPRRRRPAAVCSGGRRCPRRRFVPPPATAALGAPVKRPWRAGLRSSGGRRSHVPRRKRALNWSEWPRGAQISRFRSSRRCPAALQPEADRVPCSWASPDS